MNIIFEKLQKIKEKLLKNNNIYDDLNETDVSNEELFSILNNYNKFDNEKNTTLYKEIEFFYSNDSSHKSIFDNMTKDLVSLTSKSNYMNLLKENITDIYELKKRQLFTLKFNVSDNLNELKEVLGNEKGIYWFIKKLNPETEELINSIYLKPKSFIKSINKNKNIMNIYYNFLIVIAPLWTLLSPFILLILPYLFSKYVLKLENISINSYIQNLKNTIFGNAIFNSLKIVAEYLTLVNNSNKFDTKGFTKYQMFKYNSYKFIRILLVKIIKYIVNVNWSKYVYSFFIIISYLWSLITSYNIAKNYFRFINFIYDKVKNLYKLILTTFKLCQTVSNYENIIFKLPDNLQYLHQKVMKIFNNDLIKDLLNSKEFFNNKFYILSNKGIVLSLFFKIKNKFNKYYFLDMLNYLSYLEIYINNNNFIKRNNLCRPIYITSNNPVLLIKDMFNIICGGYNSCVKNSINLCDNNLIISGPNGSGKSTFLKTLMVSIIMAQTIGFTMADRIVITPFTYLSSYLNIPDCIGKVSLFQAEMNRCLEHLNKLEELENDNKYSLNIMDEIFVSTNYLEGASGAWAIMNNVNKFKKSINIITTHFDICLKNKINRYLYKHFSLMDNFDPNYKLLDGINEKHCALNLMKNKGFDNDIINDAEKFYKENNLKKLH